jgi:transcription initiation factor IIE alpha subunit
MNPIIPDSEPMEVTCPKCHKKIKQTVGWFKGSNRSCPHCGAGIDSSDFRRGLEEAQREVEKAFRQMQDTFNRAFGR